MLVIVIGMCYTFMHTHTHKISVTVGSVPLTHILYLYETFISFLWARKFSWFILNTLYSIQQCILPCLPRCTINLFLFHGINIRNIIRKFCTTRNVRCTFIKMLNLKNKKNTPQKHNRYSK